MEFKETCLRTWVAAADGMELPRPAILHVPSDDPVSNAIMPISGTGQYVMYAWWNFSASNKVGRRQEQNG